MTDISTQFSFNRSAQDVINPYWLRMELVESEDGQMTVGEAADFIDSLYNVSICGVPDLVEEPEGEDWDRAFAAITLPTCDNIKAMETDPGSYDCQVRVYRSHPYELYKMLLTNGTLGLPRRVKERVIETLDIEDKHYVTLDRPIWDRPVVAWQGVDGPDIHIMGNTLWWEGDFTGVIRIEFGTVFDLVAIHVHGINNQDSDIITGTDESFFGNGWYSGDEDGSELLNIKDTECTAIAFYHYQYEELVLHKPENDDFNDMTELCAYAGSTHVGDGGFRSSKGEGEGDCYAKKGFNDICICGGEETEVVEEVPVPCPDGTDPGSHVPGSDKNSITDRYKDCNNNDDVYSPIFYEDTCCEPWPFGDLPLPKCREHYAKFIGVKLTEERISEIKQQYGDNCNIIGVGPREGACGSIITTQDVDQQDCCDGVLALSYDTENSAETITPDSLAVVFVTGGQLPLTVKVRGDGFYLNAAHTIRDAVIDGRAIEIFADADACGGASISVDDGCSNTGGNIRSTDGAWVGVPWHDDFCGCTGEYVTGEVQGVQVFQCMTGNYRLVENAYNTTANACEACNVNNSYITCMTKDSLTPGGTITNTKPCSNHDFWKVDYPIIGSRCREALNKSITEWVCS